ncbi:MAG: TetR/AcrR family transcriptional regulator [Nonlabens sp.]
MEAILNNLQIEINENLYLKDPESSVLGKRIIQKSIELIHNLGFEQFTFKKLGVLLKSNESSIYRYFENKHKLLLYLTSWYWSWIENQVAIATVIIDNKRDKLETAIRIICTEVVQDSSYEHINEVLLSKIIVAENTKAHHTKEVDTENREGYFKVYKRLINRIKDMVAAVDPTYEYPLSLASTMVEGTLHQHFLQHHFTAITDCGVQTGPTDYFIDLTKRLLH